MASDPETTAARRKPRPLPTPEPGQTWHTTKPRSFDRKVLKVEQWKHRTAVFVEGLGFMSLGEFHAWARRAEAKPFAMEPRQPERAA